MRLRLLNLEGERDRLAHERAQLRRELVAVVYAPGSLGWAEPEARAICERLNPIVRQWEAVLAQLRGIHMEKTDAA